MKVTVKDKYLNVRMGKPSVNARCIQYLSPGSEIEVEDKLYPGDPYNGISTWYRDEMNNYYWSGGVEVPVPGKGPQTGKVNYNALLVFSEQLKQTKGKGVKIAVLDSGVYKEHPDLISNLGADACFDVTNSANGVDDVDGHGSHCAGIIGASGSATGLITGIAPEAKLYSIKVAHENFGPSEERVAKGIEKAIELNVDIINLSLEVDDPTNVHLKTAIQKAYASGMIMVAAAGENEKLAQGKNFLFPAMFDECIAIGAVDKIVQGTPFNPKLSFIMPYVLFYSCDTKGNQMYSWKKGSSMAAAFLSGTIALLLSGNRLKKDKEAKANVMKLLNTELHGVADFNSNVEQQISIIKLA